MGTSLEHKKGRAPGEKADWEKFSEWVKVYERERLNDKTPLERIKIFESLYQTALTLHKAKIKWVSDEDAKRSEHLKRLIEMRKLFAEKRRD
jgi:hypothetical protein